MDDLHRSAELLDRALDSLAIAAVRHPELSKDFARRCEHLQQLRARSDRPDSGGASRVGFRSTLTSVPERCANRTQSGRARTPPSKPSATTRASCYRVPDGSALLVALRNSTLL